jgi:hypothetical protein
MPPFQYFSFPSTRNTGHEQVIEEESYDTTTDSSSNNNNNDDDDNTRSTMDDGQEESSYTVDTSFDNSNTKDRNYQQRHRHHLLVQPTVHEEKIQATSSGAFENEADTHTDTDCGNGISPSSYHDLAYARGNWSYSRSRLTSSNNDKSNAKMNMNALDSIFDDTTNVDDIIDDDDEIQITDQDFTNFAFASNKSSFAESKIGTCAEVVVSEEAETALLSPTDLDLAGTTSSNKDERKKRFHRPPTPATIEQQHNHPTQQDDYSVEDIIEEVKRSLQLVTRIDSNQQHQLSTTPVPDGARATTTPTGSFSNRSVAPITTTDMSSNIIGCDDLPTNGDTHDTKETLDSSNNNKDNKRRSGSNKKLHDTSPATAVDTQWQSTSTHSTGTSGSRRVSDLMIGLVSLTSSSNHGSHNRSINRNATTTTTLPMPTLPPSNMSLTLMQDLFSDEIAAAAATSTTVVEQTSKLPSPPPPPLESGSEVSPNVPNRKTTTSLWDGTISLSIKPKSKSKSNINNTALSNTVTTPRSDGIAAVAAARIVKARRRHSSIEPPSPPLAALVQTSSTPTSPVLHRTSSACIAPDGSTNNTSSIPPPVTKIINDDRANETFISDITGHSYHANDSFVMSPNETTRRKRSDHHFHLPHHANVDLVQEILPKATAAVMLSIKLPNRKRLCPKKIYIIINNNNCQSYRPAMLVV